MSVNELAPSTVSYNMDICRDWMMKNKEEIIKLEKTVERISDGSSAEESEEEPEPPPVATRRKVSFADAFGLDLVSVKEYDNRDVSRTEVDGIEGDEYYISCLFTLPVLNRDMEVRLQKQKLELERIELLPGSTTIRGIVRVLNLCFHKAVYIRVTLDGWQSHSELLAEYVPGSSDGETDCFSFLLVLTPPFQVEGVRVEFCLRYESDVGTFWDNNGGTNYIVFFQRLAAHLTFTGAVHLTRRHCSCASPSLLAADQQQHGSQRPTHTHGALAFPPGACPDRRGV